MPGFFSVFLEPVYIGSPLVRWGETRVTHVFINWCIFPLKKCTNAFSPGINSSSTSLSNLAQEFANFASLYSESVALNFANRNRHICGVPQVC